MGLCQLFGAISRGNTPTLMVQRKFVQPNKLSFSADIRHGLSFMRGRITNSKDLARRLVMFKYDPFGRRIYKSSSAVTSVYAYDGDNLIEETNASGAVVARYSQGLNIDEPLAMLRSSATSFYQADGLGSVTSLSNAAGALAQTYTFDSFGNQTAASGSLTNPFQYTG